MVLKLTDPNYNFKTRTIKLIQQNLYEPNSNQWDIFLTVPLMQAGPIKTKWPRVLWTLDLHLLSIKPIQ